MSKKSKKIFFVLPLALFILLPRGFVLAVCYELESFGNVGANGIYEEVGTKTGNVVGSPIFSNGSFYLNHGAECNGSDDGWYMTTIFDQVCSTTNYYGSADGATPDDATTGGWSVISGTNPAGTVTEVSCDVGGSATSTTVSVQQSPHYYFYGFSLFVLGLYLSRKIL